MLLVVLRLGVKSSAVDIVHPVDIMLQRTSWGNTIHRGCESRLDNAINHVK